MGASVFFIQRFHMKFLMPWFYPKTTVESMWNLWSILYAAQRGQKEKEVGGGGIQIDSKCKVITPIIVISKACRSSQPISAYLIHLINQCSPLEIILMPRTWNCSELEGYSLGYQNTYVPTGWVVYLAKSELNLSPNVFMLVAVIRIL